jgi:PilZ domain-containing protein
MTDSKAQGTEKGSTLHLADRRRSHRVVIRVPVSVAVGGAHATTFAAHTVAVNDHGAMLAAPHALATDTEMEITNERTRQTVKARVTRTPPESSEGFLIPVEFTTAAPGFWQISFPPRDWKPLD